MRHRPANLYLYSAGAKTHFRLNDINDKAWNCNKTEFQGKLFTVRRKLGKNGDGQPVL